MPSLQDQQRYMVACRIDGNSTADPDHPYADLTLSGLRELVLSQLAATKGTEVSQTALVTHYSRRKGWCDLMGEAKLRETEFWFQGSYILVRITVKLPWSPAEPLGPSKTSLLPSVHGL